MFDPQYIITLYFNGDEALTQGDVDHLSEWIGQSHENAVEFIQASFMHRAIHDSLVGTDLKKNALLDLNEATTSAYEVVMDSNVSLDGVDVTKDVLSNEKEDTVAGYQLSLDNNVMQALQELAEFEETAPTVHAEKPIEEPTEPVGPPVIKPARPERKMSKFTIFTLAFSAAAMLFFAAIIFFMPVHPDVAILTDSIDAEWVDTKDIPVDGDPLSQGEMTLSKGFAEITFDDGAVVTVEAPAVFKLESPKAMFLTSGKVSAIVSEYATGFTINTLSASIVDLGTEFGVNVEDNGSCNLSMFKGLANLIVGQEGQKRTTQRVNASEARSVDLTGVVKDVRLDEKGFVRSIDSEDEFIWRGENVDLADIVGGGNGFGNGLQNCNINLLTGEYSEPLDSVTQYTDNEYHSCEELGFVDGVFVPDGGSGPVQVTSQGHLWKDSPDTSGLFNRSHIHTGSQARDNVPHGFVLNGQQYGTVEHPAIVTHCNAGVTFDLGALRPHLFGRKIIRFEALCGISQEAGNTYPGNASHFFVLVDGEKRFEAKGVGVFSEPGEVSIELNEEDRFLTLVSTEGDRIRRHDWSFYAEPRLVLE